MENLNLFRVFLQPLFDLIAMMNTKIIQNQADLATGIFRQTGHKLDQALGIHGIALHHEPHLPTVGDGRDNTEMTLLGHHPDDGSLSSRGKSPDMVCAGLNTRFILHLWTMSTRICLFHIRYLSQKYLNCYIYLPR